jgi:hypothetical protein
VTTFASGAPFGGLSAGSPAGAYYACDLNGQLYRIASGVVTSFGIKTGATTDGPVGTDTTLPFGAPSPYALQGTTANFFGSASTPTLPYSLAPFNSAGPIFAPAARTAVAGAPLNLAADTNAQNIGATQVGAATSSWAVIYVTAAMAGTNPALTPESLLFSDHGIVRTLVP